MGVVRSANRDTGYPDMLIALRRGIRKSRATRARLEVFVGVKPTITFQRGTAGCTTVAKSGRMSQPAAYSTRKLWARNLGRATQRLACQPCGPRKRWEILLGCGEKAMMQHCRRLRFARAGAAVGLPLLNSANAAPWRRENRETPGCARAT